MRGWGKSETQTVLDRDRILGTRCPSILQESICFPHQKTFYLSGRSVEKGGGKISKIRTDPDMEWWFHPEGR